MSGCMERIGREMEMSDLEFRKVKALEEIADYLRRIDAEMQVLLQTLERIDSHVESMGP